MIALITYYYINRQGLTQSDALLKAFIPGMLADFFIAAALIRSLM